MIIFSVDSSQAVVRKTFFFRNGPFVRVFIKLTVHFGIFINLRVCNGMFNSTWLLFYIVLVYACALYVCVCVVMCLELMKIIFFRFPI